MPTSIRTALDRAGVGSVAALTDATGIEDRSVRRQSARALIDARYAELGGFKSDLGLSLTDIRDADDGGYSHRYAGAPLNVYADVVKAPNERDCVIVRCVGFKCLEESNELSASDEPYFIIGVAGASGSNTVKFGPYENVDAGEEVHTVGEIVGLAHMVPPPIVIGVVAMEHDEGTPAEAEAKVRKVVEAIEGKLDEAAAAFGVQTDDGHVMPEWMRDILIGWVPEGIAAVFALGDDSVGSTAKLMFDYDMDNDEWVSPPVLGDFGPNKYRLKLPVGQNPEEGRYEVYFDIRTAKVSVTVS